MVLFILAQNPKGGGLSATFGGGGGNQIIGARQTTDFLEKTTWYIAIGILAIVILSNAFIPNTQSQTGEDSMMSEQIENMSNPIPQNPNVPAPIENAQQGAQGGAQPGVPQQQQQQTPALPPEEQPQEE